MTLAKQRRAIRHLLDENNPADGMASYFAFHYDDTKTHLSTYPPNADRASGYVALSRTGIDLFRPFMTLRLPDQDMRAAAALIYQALPVHSSIIMNAPIRYYPLLQALFDVQTEEKLLIYILDPSQFEPIINVLVTQDRGVNGLPRFIIRARDTEEQTVAASAGLNWLTPTFGEISVTTAPGFRRRGMGRSVVANMANYLLQTGRQPLYVVSEGNEASIQLAESVGFVYAGVEQLMLQATLREDPTAVS